MSLAMADAHFELHGAVMLAGSYRGYEEILLSEKEKELKAQNLSDTEIDAQLSDMKQAVSEIQALDTEDTDALLLGYPGAYWKQMTAYKAERYIKGVSVPILVLHPEADEVYTYETDYLPLEELVKDNTLISTETYEGLDHDFKDETGTSVSADMISDLAEWILE